MWQESGARRGFVATSDDGGTSWNDLLEVPCNVHSAPVWKDGWWIACGDDAGTSIFRVDAGNVERVATVSGFSGTRIMARHGDGFVLAGASTGTIRISPDGRTWGPVVDLAPTVASDDRWLGWLTSDGDAILSLVWDRNGGCPFCADHQVTRTLVQATERGIVASAPLQPSSGWEFDGPGPRAFGEFDGIACKDVCLAAWPDEGRIVHAWLGPRPNAFI